MKQQTAVEWLVAKYNIVCGLGSYELMKEHIERAKAMEKEQIINAYRHGRTDEQSSIPKWHDRSSSQYYADTYQSTQDK